MTPLGEQKAKEVIRHHRLLELYLARELGYTWDKVHDEADRLEHVISEEFEDRLDELLGYPTIDPHGDPIPSKEGLMVARNGLKLSRGERRPGSSYSTRERSGPGETLLLRETWPVS